MPEMMPLIWLGVVVLIIVIEACTMDLVAIWFLPGALISLVMSLFDATTPWQITVFVIVSLLSFIPLFVYHKTKAKKDKRTNIDAVIGQTVLVTERICNIDSVGAAKLSGQVWTARAEQDDVTFEPGELAEVVAVRGVKLICRKKA